MFSTIEKEREWRATYSRDRYRRRMDAIIEFLGGKCVVCGISEKLHTHHRDPSTKKFDISTHHSRPWVEVVEEAKKCKLRCREHHDAAHVESPAHGTPSRYNKRKYRCRCDLCRAAWNEACRKWKQDFRARNRPALRTSEP